jgi:hypothetical protein
MCNTIDPLKTETRPEINVLDHHAYFNITRSATFEDLNFRGE